MRKRFRAVVASSFKAKACQGAMVLSIAMSSLCYPTLASALGIGEISLHSALNQPLDADIELVETQGLSAEDVIVKLASPEAFAEAGVERLFFLSDLRFTPVIRGNRGVVHVASSKAVTEPYLNFLVQLVRPNGDLLREYTLLLDPANTPQGLAVTRTRQQRLDTGNDNGSRMPVAPPAAVEGKHYTVASGDTLSGIARRLQGPGSKVSAAQLADGIQALNPQVFAGGSGAALKAGQNLLLPDTAVLPSTPAAPAAAASETGAPVELAQSQRAAEQLAAAALENQALERTVEDLKAQAQSLQDQVSGKNQEITALQTQLSQQAQPAPAAAGSSPAAAGSNAAAAGSAATASTPASAAVATPVAASPAAVTPTTAPPAAAPVAAPQPAPVAAEPWLNVPMLMGALLIIVLLLGLLYSRRRQRAAAPHAPLTTADDPLIKPAQATTASVYEVPAVAPQPAPAPVAASAALASKPAASQRLAGAAPDALDGVSIYIAYGRFNEAMGILRDALQKEPEREDIRVRILELLAEQGDSAGFAAEEKAALQQGVAPETVQEVRSRYPQLKPAEPVVAKPDLTKPEPARSEPARTEPVAPLIVAGAAAAGAALAASAASQPSATEEPAPLDLDLGDLDLSELDLDPPSASAPSPAPAAQLDETAAAALNPEPADEFQLNLDELSMDADWDLVDPFDTPSRSKPEAAVPEVDPNFASNLTQLPEVMELQEEQFLSDFAEETELSGQAEAIESIEVIEPADSDALDDAFLDSFADDGVEFDLLDIEEEPLSQINEAQLLIDEGDTEAARLLLQQIIDEADEAHQQMARDLLSSLD